MRRILLIGAFVIAVGALMADAVISSLFDLSRQEVERSEVITRDSERLWRLLVDLESEVRGPTAEGDDRYLTSDVTLAPLFGEMHVALKADPAGEQRIAHLEQLLQSWPRAPGPPLLAQIRGETEGFCTYERAQRQAAQQRLERRRRNVRLIIGATFASASLLMVATMLAMTRRLGRSIGRLVQVSEAIANAQFDVAIGDERDELGRLARSLQTTARQLDRRTRQEQALLAAGRALSDPGAQKQLLPALHEAVREIVDLKMLVLLGIGDGTQRVLTSHPATPDVPVDVAGPIRPGGALAHAIASRHSVIITDPSDDRWPENAMARQLGAGWYAFVPLVANGRVETVLVVSADGPGGKLYHGDQTFLDLLGQQIAGTLTTARLYGELEERNQELERAGRAKSDFLALMSHELRTPLNSIIGFSQVLIDQKYGQLSERQGRYLQNIYSSGRHLLQLINDLLDLSKIEAGRFTVELQGCSLGELVVDALATLKPLADAKQLVVRNPAPPPPVRADALRLKQVLYNILSNAIKFTPTGGAITLGHELVGDDERTVRFAVSDNGPGISDEDQRRLFHPFVQVGSAAMQGLGSGLGLLLSRQLIELMGGQMGVRSTLGSGATFYFNLPLAQPATRATAPQPTTTAPLRRATPSAPLALIVDDQLSARELLQEELEQLGFRTLLADSGERALELARQAKPDLITLDILMPGCDGWEVLRRLRAEPELAPIPALVISITDESPRALGLGALNLLVKPLHKGGLHEVLVRHKLVRPTESRILAVDDNREHLDMLRLLLEPLGFQLRTAETGAEGVGAALSAPADVVLLDVQLPDRSGIDVVAELRQHEILRRLPILLLTGAELTAEEQARLNGEVVAELAKSSLRPDELIRHIERAVAGARRPEGS